MAKLSTAAAARDPATATGAQTDSCEDGKPDLVEAELGDVQRPLIRLGETGGDTGSCEDRNRRSYRCQ